MIRFAALILLVSLLPIAAHGTIYRCTDAKGKTTLQDVPCQPPSPNSDTSASASAQSSTTSKSAASGATGAPSTNTSDYSTTRGTWRGPVQFHVVAGGQRDLAAHRISILVIELAADSKVTGIINQAGCKMSGMTTQLAMPTMANVDVTLTGCRDSRFNTRMSGTLAVSASSKETKLHLFDVGFTRTNQVQQLTLDAVLRR